MRDTFGDFGLGDDVVDGGGDAAEVLAERADVDVDDAAELVVIDFGGRLDAVDAGDRVETRADCGRPAAAQRNGAQVGDAAHLVLGVLHGEHVVVAVAGIDPVAGRDHLVRGERGDDVADDFALVEAELAGAGAVDIELERGIVEVLRDVDVG